MLPLEACQRNGLRQRDDTWVGPQVSEEDIAAKQRAVHRYRSMFIYGTQPQHPPSASDIALEMMCTYIKYGIRD